MLLHTWETWDLNFKPRNWIVGFSLSCSIHTSGDLEKLCYYTLSINSVPQHKKFTDLRHLWGSIYEEKLIMYRCSRPEAFLKKRVLRNFTKLTGKHICWSVFFNKVATLHFVALLKKTLWHKYFQDHIFIEHLRMTASKYNVTLSGTI